jgi:protein BCP1
MPTKRRQDNDEEGSETETVTDFLSLLNHPLISVQ